MARGTRGAYRKEDRIQLPPELQKELVEKAAAKVGNCQELARFLDIPKSSVHYYLVSRLTMPASVLRRMVEIAGDESLSSRITEEGGTREWMWAIRNAKDVFIESCKQRVRLPMEWELSADDRLRRKCASIISYIQAEGSVWVMKEKWNELAVNITFADHESDLYDHFRALCLDVFRYDIGTPQRPGNGTRAIRGFIYSKYVAEWIAKQGVPLGDKAAQPMHLPAWVLESEDPITWISALQPWCDGEGSVKPHNGITRPSFSLTQARHTEIDFSEIPISVSTKKMCRTVPSGFLRTLSIYGVPFIDYCRLRCRSEVFDDVVALFRRLGFRPRLKMYGVHLKDDGYWSVHWSISFSVVETNRLVELGLITQSRKIEWADS